MRAGTGTWIILAGAACGLVFAGYLEGASASTPPPTIGTTRDFDPDSLREGLPAFFPVPSELAGWGGLRRGSGSGQDWIVVEVMDPKGEVSYEAILRKALKDRITQAENDYLNALDSWKKAKNLAAANKTKFEEKKPVPGYVERVHTTPATFRSKGQAEAVVLALTEQIQERRKAKGTR